MDKIEEKVDEFKGKFRLVHGCISQDNRITSRDIGRPEYFGTLEEAQKELNGHSDFYERVGYKLWFSRLAIWDEKKQQYIEEPRTNFMNG